MTKSSEAISELFNVDDVIQETLPAVINAETSLVPVANPIPEVPEDTNLESDFSFAQATLRSVIEQGQDALTKLSKVAKEDEKARSYEVVSTLLKTIADTAGQLMDLQKKKRDLDPKPAIPAQGVNYIDKAVFVGRPEDLLERVKYNING